MNLDYIYILLPLIFGILTTLFCFPKSKSQNKLPSELFIIVWPILYILIGVSWFLSRKNLNGNNFSISNILFWILNLCLCLWLIMSSCLNYKMTATYILFICLLLAFLCYTSLEMKTEKYLISPLIIWLIVAVIISINSI
jgi:tryptophan-rich sensory protein